MGRVAAVEQDAEFVAAEPVRGALGRNCRAQSRREPDEKRVTDDVPVGVVVALEAIEVEEGKRGRSVTFAEQVFEIGDQLPAIAQTGERIRDCLTARRAQDSDILQVRQSRACGCQTQRAGGKSNRQRSHCRKGRNDEQCQRDHCRYEREDDCVRGSHYRLGPTAGRRPRGQRQQRERREIATLSRAPEI